MTHLLLIALLGLPLDPTAAHPEPTQQPPAEAPKPGDDPIRAFGQQFNDAFNQNDATALALLFAEDAEVITEDGNDHRGREAITEVFRTFFEAHPDAKVEREVVESRLVGQSLAIEDGLMTITAPERSTARSRYLAVMVKGDNGWQFASIRQVADDESEASPHGYLEPLAWLVGEWVSEQSDPRVSLSCRWSEDGNYLLVDYTIGREGEVEMQTNQRIGWDASLGVIRSWNFDSDGGFSEGRWASDGSAWLVKSELVLPDGLTGWATFYLSPVDENRFLWGSVDRVIAGSVQPDVEVAIVRKPPAPGDR